MPRFYRRVLRALDDIYSVIGGAPVAPTSIDTATPLQLVHDVSREAEISSGAGPFDGFFHAGWRCEVGAGGNPTYDTGSLYGPAAGGVNWDPDYTSQWVWLMKLWAAVQQDGNQGNFSDCQFFWFGQSLQGIGPGSVSAIQPELLFHSATRIGRPSTLRPASGYYGVQPAYETAYPRLMIPLSPDADTFQMVASGTGAVNVNGGALLWLGPRGVLPPGMA